MEETRGYFSISKQRNRTIWPELGDAPAGIILYGHTDFCVCDRGTKAGYLWRYNIFDTYVLPLTDGVDDNFNLIDDNAFPYTAREY